MVINYTRQYIVTIEIMANYTGETGKKMQEKCPPIQSSEDKFLEDFVRLAEYFIFLMATKKIDKTLEDVRNAQRRAGSLTNTIVWLPTPIQHLLFRKSKLGNANQCLKSI